MFHSISNLKRYLPSVRLAALLIAAFVARPAEAHETGLPHTHGPNDPTVTYHVDFSTDLNLMFNPTDPVAQHYAMWKTPIQMASLRSAPFIRVTNDSSSSMQLTNMRIDLGITGYQFDSFAFFEQPDDGAANIVSHTDLSYGGDMRNFLEIDFPSGLNPGDSFTFQVRIARLIPPGIGGSGLANYEEVLWQYNNQGVPNRLDNALVSTRFHQVFDSGLDLTVNMTPVRLFEYPLANESYATDADGASGSVYILPNAHEMIDVAYARFSQGVQVPEPGAMALVFAGAATFGARYWKRRRANLAA